MACRYQPGAAVAAEVALQQVAERQHDRPQRKRHQQVDGAKARQAQPPAAADEQGRQRGEHHERDPGIACSAVQAWALCLAAACPQGHWAQGGGQHGGGEVDGNSGTEVRQGRQGGGHGGHLCGMAGMDMTVPLSPRSHHRFATNCTVTARNAGGLPRVAARFGRGAQVLHRLRVETVPNQDAARR